MDILQDFNFILKETITEDTPFLVTFHCFSADSYPVSNHYVDFLFQLPSKVCHLQ